MGAIGQFLSKAIESPPLDAVIEAEVLLRDMKCLDENGDLTALGKILARLPLEPRLGKMMILATIFNVADPMSTIAAYASTFSEIFLMELGQKRLMNHQRYLSGDRYSDHVAMAVAFNMFKRCNDDETEEIRLCEYKGLQRTTLRIIFEARKQLLDLLKQSGFPESAMEFMRINNSGFDPRLDLVVGLLCSGMYPNICYHKSKRKTLTTESKAALIHKTSVNCVNYDIQFPYPFFVFGEKIRTRTVSCKQMTMVSPIHVLLFGCKRVDVTKDNTLIIDNWLVFDMDPYVGSLILSLKPAIESLIIQGAEEPEDVLRLEPKWVRLIDVVNELCVMTAGDYGINRNTGQRSQGDGNQYKRFRDFQSDQVEESTTSGYTDLSRQRYFNSGIN